MLKAGRPGWAVGLGMWNRQIGWTYRLNLWFLGMWSEVQTQPGHRYVEWTNGLDL